MPSVEKKFEPISLNCSTCLPDSDDVFFVENAELSLCDTEQRRDIDER